MEYTWHFAIIKILLIPIQRFNESDEWYDDHLRNIVLRKISWWNMQCAFRRILFTHKYIRNDIWKIKSTTWLPYFICFRLVCTVTHISNCLSLFLVTFTLSKLQSVREAPFVAYLFFTTQHKPQVFNFSSKHFHCFYNIMETCVVGYLVKQLLSARL